VRLLAGCQSLLRDRPYRRDASGRRQCTPYQRVSADPQSRLRQLRPPPSRTAVAPELRLRRRLPGLALGERDFGPGDHLDSWPLRSQRSSTQVDTRSASRGVPPDLSSEKSTDLSSEMSRPSVAHRRSPHSAPAECTQTASAECTDRCTSASLWFSFCSPPETGTTGIGLRPQATDFGPPHSGPRIQPSQVKRHC